VQSLVNDALQDVRQDLRANQDARQLLAVLATETALSLMRRVKTVMANVQDRRTVNPAALVDASRTFMRTQDDVLDGAVERFPAEMQPYARFTRAGQQILRKQQIKRFKKAQAKIEQGGAGTAQAQRDADEIRRALGMNTKQICGAHA